MEDTPHIPVMLDECIEGLRISPGGVFFDGTVGYGGHSSEILKRILPDGKLIACDRDGEAVAYVIEKFRGYEKNVSVYRSDFKDFESILEKENTDTLDGAILDLGISSRQIDDRERGFSYLCADAPLDMRMDTSQPFTAADLLNDWPEEEIARVLKEYGEEAFARQIAANVAKQRKNGRLTTCGEFTEIIEKSIPYRYRQNGPCARKSFQAVRIAVNGELDGLYECVVALARRLSKGGRMAVLTFHSLEDRIVKKAFKYLEADCVCDKGVPVCVCGKTREIDIITKKPLTAGGPELERNSRSKSAKLRIAEKI